MTARLVDMENNSSNALLLMTLAGVESAVIEGEDFVVGRWRKDMVYLTNRAVKGRAPSLVAKFANWDDSPEQIARFTLRFGPLVTPTERGDLVFSQSISDWRDFQGFIRRQWAFGRSLGYKVGMRQGEEIHIDKDGKVSTVVLESLARFLEFELWTAPRAYRLKFACPDCKSPYLIASRVDQQVGDHPDCMAWAQRKFKKEWWTANGEKWRKERAKKRRKAKRSQ
jgi:hypothetical protein